MTPDLDRHNTADPKPKMLSTDKRIQHGERNVRGIEHAHMLRKTTF